MQCGGVFDEGACLVAFFGIDEDKLCNPDELGVDCLELVACENAHHVGRDGLDLLEVAVEEPEVLLGIGRGGKTAEYKAACGLLL